MEETQATPAPEVNPEAKKLSKEERSQIATDAAKRRWAKAKKAKNAKPKKGVVKGKSAASPKKPKGPREFSSALKVAEKRLSKAIQERAEAGAKYAVLSAEIPSLQRIMAALRNPEATVPGFGHFAPAPSLEQIVGDQDLSYQNPPRVAHTPATGPHPVASQGRAMGGAIGLEIQEEESEDKFLSDSGVAGGQWH